MSKVNNKGNNKGKKIVRKGVNKMNIIDLPSLDQCIISVDVGVKNLAVCVLGKDARQIHILFWKWYDVTGSAQETPPLKKNAPSKRKGADAADVADAASAKIGTCISIVRKTGKPCGKPGPMNSRGRAYCGIHDPSRKHNPVDTQEWCYAMVKSLPRITHDIVSALDTWKITAPSLQVVIEQQSIDNKKILLQSHLIYGHFVSHFDNAVPVKFVPAYNKLLAYEGPEIVSSLKTAYARRKFLAKKHTEDFLNRNPQMNTWKGFFDSCKNKQDDISDAFLQGMYVLSSGKKVKTTTEMKDGKAIKKRKKKIRF